MAEDELGDGAALGGWEWRGMEAPSLRRLMEGGEGGEGGEEEGEEGEGGEGEGEGGGRVMRIWVMRVVGVLRWALSAALMRSSSKRWSSAGV